MQVNLLWSPLLTFTVLTACTATTSSEVVGRLVHRMGVVGVRDRVLVGECYGPRGSSRVGQGGKGVLIGRPTRAIVVVQGEIGHVCERGHVIHSFIQEMKEDLDGKTKLLPKKKKRPRNKFIFGLQNRDSDYIMQKE